MPKKVLIALPPAMLETVDFIAAEEHRTRSDLIREALRRYIKTFDRENPGHPISVSTTDVVARPAVAIAAPPAESEAPAPFFTVDGYKPEVQPHG